MTEIPFRSLAADHLKAAKDLLLAKDTQDESHRQVIYACLELRMAIEALTYELFQSYEAELSAGAMKKWTPKHVLDELLYIDDEADKSRTIKISKSETNEVVFEGENRRFSAKWASKAHNTLGSFLHQSTMLQLQTGSAPTNTKAKIKAFEIITHLENIMNSPVAMFRAHRLVKFPCRCGHQIARDLEYLKSGKAVSCVQCGCGYDYTIGDDGSVQFRLQEEVFHCGKCEAKNVLLRHELSNGARINCCECGVLSVILSRWVVHYLEGTERTGAGNATADA